MVELEPSGETRWCRELSKLLENEMKIYLVEQQWYNGVMDGGSHPVEYYDNMQKAADHMLTLINDTTFDYTLNDQGQIIFILDDEHGHTSYTIEEVEVK